MHLLDLLFPKRCVGCKKVGTYFCIPCQKSVAYASSICPICEGLAIDGRTHPRCQTRYTLDGLTSFFRYNGIIRQAIKTIKYRLVSDLAEEFIELIPNKFISQLTMQQCNNETILIPIPLHPARLAFRGFNQAEVLGRILAKRFGIPVRTDVLQRMRKTLPQVEMKERKKRLENMEGVFAINSRRRVGIHDAVIPIKSGTSSGQLNNETILLFDDVFTTGATLRAAANVLKRAGAKCVWGIVLAHG